MASENFFSNNFLSMSVNSINVFHCDLSGVNRVGKFSFKKQRMELQPDILNCQTEILEKYHTH